MLLTARPRAAREHDELFQLEVLQIGSEQRTDDDAWLLLMQRAPTSRTRPWAACSIRRRATRSYAMAVPLFDAAALELPPRHPAPPPGGGAGDAARRRLHRRRGGGHRRAASSRCSCWWWSAWPSASASRSARSWCGRCAGCWRGSTPSARATCRASSWPSATTRSATLAGRFNAMTGSLREAREETERGAERPPGAGGAAAPVREAGHHRPDGGRDRPRGGHARSTSSAAAPARWRRRPSARPRPPRSRGARRRGEERRHHRRRGRAHHQDHPAGARLLAPARADRHPGAPRRGGGRGAGVPARDDPPPGHRGRRAAPCRRRRRSRAIPIRSSRSASTCS